MGDCKSCVGPAHLPSAPINDAATPAVIIGSQLGISLSSSLNEYAYRTILFVTLAGMGLKIAC